MHQNPGIFLDLTVAENIAIGARFPTDPVGRIRWEALRARTQELIYRYINDLFTGFALILAVAISVLLGRRRHGR